MTAKSKPHAKRRILVVEDEQALREMYSTWLKAKGYEVISADNGLTAVQMAFHEAPDAIVLDVLLPKKDGFEVLTEIRRNPKTSKMPVVILSSLDQDFEQRRGLTLGAHLYLVKTTISPEVLYDAINKLLNA